MDEAMMAKAPAATATAGISRGCDRRTLIAGMLATSALAACAPPRGAGAAPAPSAATGSGAAAQAQALYDRLFAAYLEINPETATSLGLDTGAHAGLRSRLGSSAAADRFGFAKTLAETRRAAAAIDASGLDAQQRTYLDVVRWFTDRAAEIVQPPYGGFDGYPVPYTLTQLTGSYQVVPDFLDSTHPIQTAADAEAYLSRLEAMAVNVRDEVERSRAEAGMGVIPPDFIIAKTLTQTRALRAQGGPDKGMAAVLARKTAAAGIAGDWAARAARIVDGPIAAALDAQAALLASLQPRATAEAGVSRLPGGMDFYATCLRYHTSTALTPDEAHQRGLDEVRDYEARIDPLLRALGLNDGSVGARLTALGQRPDQLWPNTDAGRAEILAYANQRIDAVRPLMARMFNHPPAAPLDIRRVPPAIEVGAPRGYAQRGSLDGSRPGAFYINLRDTNVWPRFAIPTLVYHEGIPGHVFQGAVALETQGIPMLHRSLYIAAYGEGWALYAEQLADELGVYDNEPLGRIGYLQAALYRAVRVVVDTGMHARGWSRERATRFMIDVTGIAPGAAENEIDRYIVWPGQATSYKLGHSEIVRTRAAAQARLGARFDIKGFHDVVLRSGSQPLEVLRRNVDQWAASQA
jgi:uncharacterized protein (DUF885 family)